jgi:hypothetical protein
MVRIHQGAQRGASLIYRILCNSVTIAPRQPGEPEVVLQNGQFDMKLPRITNARARFYFTEAGWERVGRSVAANARQEGRVVKVIRRKNPETSQIVYQDELQVAIIPIKHKPKR